MVDLSLLFPEVNPQFEEMTSVDPIIFQLFLNQFIKTRTSFGQQIVERKIIIPMPTPPFWSSYKWTLGKVVIFCEMDHGSR